MYDVLKGDYTKPNGITENRLQKVYNTKPSFLKSERWFCLSGAFRCENQPSVLPRKENNEIKSTAHKYRALIRDKHFRLAVFCKDYRRRKQIL